MYILIAVNNTGTPEVQAVASSPSELNDMAHSFGHSDTRCAAIEIAAQLANGSTAAQLVHYTTGLYVQHR
jgi:hypothetical protein